MRNIFRQKKTKKKTKEIKDGRLRDFKNLFEY